MKIDKIGFSEKRSDDVFVVLDAWMNREYWKKKFLLGRYMEKAFDFVDDEERWGAATALMHYNYLNVVDG